MTVSVKEFYHGRSADHLFDLPESKLTRVAVPGTLTLSAMTVAIEITADADCRMSVGQANVAASDTPILSAVPNQFPILRGPGVLLRFL